MCVFMKALNSLSQVVVSVTFGSILIKKKPHIYVREVLMKSKKGGKITDSLSVFTHTEIS